MAGEASVAGGFLGFFLDIGRWAAEDAAYAQTASLQSEEFRRARAAAEAQAADALQRGATQAGAIRTQASLLEGQQRVAYAMSGIDASSGSAAANIGSSRLIAELDAATAKNNAAREALGHRRTLQALDTQAKLIRANRQQQETGRALDMAGSFLDAIPKGV